MEQANVNPAEERTSLPARSHIARALARTALGAALVIGANIPANALTPAPATFGDFQIGWWSAVGLGNMARLQTEANSGQNYQVAYAYDPGTAAYETALATTGARSMLNVPNDYVKTTNSAALAAYVNKYKGNATITAWHLTDEPEDHGVAPITVRTAYNAVKAADPSRPIAVNYYHNNCTYVGQTMGYGDLIGDIVMFERYPIFTGAEFAGITDWTQMVDDCQNYLKAHARASFIGFIPVVQAFSWSNYNIAGRDPTYKEVRYMAYRGAIKQLALGTQFWADYQASAALTGSANRVMYEMRGDKSFPTARAGIEADPAISVSSPLVKYKHLASANGLIAVNDSATPVTVTVTLPAGLATPSVQAENDRYDPNTVSLYNNRVIYTSTNAAGRRYFTDTFNPYEVHVYNTYAIAKIR